MADNNNTTSDSGMQYFRTNILGLSVVVGEPEEGDVAPQTERFTAYEITTEFGEPVRVAYLATKNPEAIKRLKNDDNVLRVKKEEYEKYTDPENTDVKRARV